ncbi:hypothetical protein [Paenibacillus odorifer]|uniref:hypothetical protein n=1 Tax=Paenibacillus TaxID=44249 RepID=UPI0015C3760E|nr:hypothetical protein [Paenibacillus odorifer]
MFFFFTEDRQPCQIIDYRDIYDKLKDKPAGKWTREIEQFSVLYLWKQNDSREA